MNAVLQYGLYLVILVALAIPLGKYISKVMDGEKVFLSKVLVPVENFIYKIMRIDKKEDMTWKKYAVSVVSFSIFGFIILFLLNVLQGVLPLNPEGVDGTTAHLAFNTTSSFALIRGFTRVKEKGIGSFWVDLTRSILYVLIPLSIVVTLGLASQGVVQNLNSYEEVQLVQPIELEDGTVITKQVIPQGPAASQIAIKQLGTNGGGFFGVNSAHPLENPTIFSNMLEMISLLLIPAALCFSFGRSIKDKKQGRAIFLAMFIMLVVALSIVAVSEANATPQLVQAGMVDVSPVGQAGGNMEGKESRFGIATSSTWATFTTAASNGSVNSMHDSYTPLGGMITMLQMQLGEVIFGGVGCGLYGMLAFAIVAVFIAGLMVGRTPEYLGKKIDTYEMKMAMLVCLATPIAILVSSGIASLVPQVVESLNNEGAHGFSEMLYAYSSAGGNNGSAFAGFGANTPFINITIGIVMLFARFVPLIGTLAIAGSLVQKKKVAVSVGTLSTHNALFIGLLIFVVLLVGALSFFPALALGPIAEFFQMIA